MNIQARKLVLIEEFIRINDESLMTKLESLIRHEKKAIHERKLAPISINELHEMADQAKRDSDAGHVISQKALEKKVKLWQ